MNRDRLGRKNDFFGKNLGQKSRFSFPGDLSQPLSVLYLTVLAAFALLLLADPAPVEAYVGPGAGFALVTSFLVILSSLFMSLLTMITWPVRVLILALRGRKARARSRVKRVVVLGLDGQDPRLTEEFMREGFLPNFERLREAGGYRRLKTSLPAESPVAWSCFQTGCNPGRHRVFDFLVPNRKSYLPELCSARIQPPSRHLVLGPYKIPLGKPSISFDRKSRSFWTVLGEHGIFSTVLRVPISFPPEKFNGALLSAMSVPDLLGTQGTFTYFSSDPDEAGRFTSGNLLTVEVKQGRVEAEIVGPPSPLRRSERPMRIPFQVSCNGRKNALKIDGRSYPLPLREFTPWIKLRFSAGLGVGVSGMVRFYLKEASPCFKLYMSPVNIVPSDPALPISHPRAYSAYLAKTQGEFCTLGLSEDTWALNEGVLDEEAFLQQAYLVHQEREGMFFDALEKTRRGLVVCVFDITDRLQHMFWRYLEDAHPANSGKDVLRHKDAIRQLYRRMDELVGRTLDQVDDESVLFVMSDHGFNSFQRGVNLNAWLQANGFLTLRDDACGAEWLRDVDWSKTQAYAVGLGGIYLNLKGREAQGIVEPGAQAQEVKQRIMEGLQSLRDEERGGAAPVAQVYDTGRAYRGPYVGDAPDLLAGFSIGYRASWECATGIVQTPVLQDNSKRWSGDHCMNPSDVPGILFSNRPIPEASPGIMDIGPTVLDLFGVDVPEYCDGRSIMPAGAEKSGADLTPSSQAAKSRKEKAYG